MGMIMRAIKDRAKEKEKEKAREANSTELSHRPLNSLIIN